MEPTRERLFDALLDFAEIGIRRHYNVRFDADETIRGRDDEHFRGQQPVLIQFRAHDRQRGSAGDRIRRVAFGHDNDSDDAGNRRPVVLRMHQRQCLGTPHTHARRLLGGVFEVFGCYGAILALQLLRSAKLGAVERFLVAAADCGLQVGGRIDTADERLQRLNTAGSNVPDSSSSEAVEACEDVGVGFGRVGDRDAPELPVTKGNLAGGAIDGKMGIVRAGGEEIIHLLPG